MDATNHNGTTYYQSYSEARSIRDKIADYFSEARIVRYHRGWAVQLRISGPYYFDSRHDAR